MKKLSLIPALLLSAVFFMLVQAQTPDAKHIEKQFAKVNDTMYAAKYETTNAEYRLFLQQLQSSNQQALYQQYEVDSAKWKEMNAGPMVKYYHRHPALGNYPVVNISYEAALAYCAWLTEIYNKAPKRKFTTVQFVLPAETEWMMAAQGGRSQAIFPWGNYYLRNSKGQFLCNFKYINDAFIRLDSTGNPVVDEKALSASSERAIYTANVKSFWPNDLGIYNFSGNVSEMIAEKEWTKGGSWNSHGYYVQIRSRESYNGPSPQVGFRVFMKVLER